MCAKSLELGDCCGHNRVGNPVFCFHVVLIDAVYPNLSLVRAQAWDSGPIWLKASTAAWQDLAVNTQIERVNVIFQRIPKVEVTLTMKDSELRVLHATMLFEQGIPATLPPMHCRPPSIPNETSHAGYNNHGESSQKPKSAKKLLASLLLALRQTFWIRRRRKGSACDETLMAYFSLRVWKF